jgi:hypothetical protein
VGPVLTAIALTPTAPVLIPELAGAAADDVAEFRDTALTAAATLPDRWIAVGVGADDLLIEPDSRGTFAGFGADVPVTLAPGAVRELRPLPLCALIAGWLRGQVRPQAVVRVQVFRADLDAESAIARGRELRAELDALPEPVGVLVLADGANTLTQSAPGGFDPAARDVQTGLDDALAAGTPDRLAGLPDGVIGRVAYQVLAGLAPAPRAAAELVRGAPYGVGYFVGTWTP